MNERFQYNISNCMENNSAFHNSLTFIQINLSLTVLHEIMQKVLKKVTLPVLFQKCTHQSVANLSTDWTDMVLFITFKVDKLLLIAAIKSESHTKIRILLYLSYYNKFHTYIPYYFNFNVNIILHLSVHKSPESSHEISDQILQTSCLSMLTTYFKHHDLVNLILRSEELNPQISFLLNSFTFAVHFLAFVHLSVTLFPFTCSSI